MSQINRFAHIYAYYPTNSHIRIRVRARAALARADHVAKQ